ncbi:hypothetical protein [Streptomyces sp. CoH17]|uniref:hypothetical protein n=1 Tax=Streptomyces sp. CoH17 TaxID=2992806 RepID=UPI00226F18DB|nr:hypothetical protein [Streptomyces sp. CoH17]
MSFEVPLELKVDPDYLADSLAKWSQSDLAGLIRTVVAVKEESETGFAKKALLEILEDLEPKDLDFAEDLLKSGIAYIDSLD